MDHTESAEILFNSLERGLLAARMQARVGDWAGTADSCRAILRKYPDCLLVLRLLAFSAMELERPAEAAEHFLSCLKIDAEDELVYGGLALCAESQGDRRA